MYSQEMDHLRGQAITLYEQCLAEQGTQFLVNFIETQLADGPPPIVLLQRIADDLQQRLLSLRSHHFDVRKYVIDMLKEQQDMDITPYMPADALNTFHCFDTLQVLEACGLKQSAADHKRLRRILETSRNIGKQLQIDIDITADLLRMVNDWLQALSMRYGRDEWAGTYPIVWPEDQIQ